MWNTAITRADAGHSGESRRLTFHLAGINNQNFIMRDDETGSWWQQADGKAFLGPLAGTRLRPVFADEVSFATWRSEHPAGRVLRPAAGAPWQAFSADWEATTDRLPVVTAAAGPLPPRTQILGLSLGGADRAYPIDILRRQSPVMDELAGTPLILLVADDGRSLRVFEGALDHQRLAFFARPPGGAAPPGAPSAEGARWLDDVTGSGWSFAGLALSGPLAGRRLRPIAAAKDYWFDWRIYHPHTTIYTGGRSPLTP